MPLKGGSCRTWDFLAQDSNLPLASLCVDETSHLPMTLHTASLRVQYSGWNLPVAIDPPIIR